MLNVYMDPGFSALNGSDTVQNGSDLSGSNYKMVPISLAPITRIRSSQIRTIFVGKISLQNASDTIIGANCGSSEVVPMLLSEPF